MLPGSGAGLRGTTFCLVALLVVLQPPTEPGKGRVQSTRSPSVLAVHSADPQGDGWRDWWSEDHAPTRWPDGLPVVEDAVAWRPLVPGLDWGELRLAGSGEAWRLRVIIARLDPQRVALELHANVQANGMAGPWSVDVAPVRAALAFNAGQFDTSGPWGWVVHRGVEIRPPGMGVLAPAVVVDSSGSVRLVSPDRIAAVRREGSVVEAFQSYPMLLTGDGEVPSQLAATGRGVDLRHRDSRLAIGVRRDGRVLVVLTRFEGLGGALEHVPFGPTVPEMAAIMGALGCRSAVSLDGGISGQLLVRDRAGRTREWRGMRTVPLGLIAVSRGVPGDRE